MTKPVDLVNVPEEVITFLNVYPGRCGFEKVSLEDANAMCPDKERIAVLKITRVDGVITKKEVVA